MSKIIILVIMMVAVFAEENNSTNTTNTTSKMDFVNGITESWGKITQAFKTSIKTEIVSNVTDGGFSKFESSGSTILKWGLPTSYYPRFIESVARLI